MIQFNVDYTIHELSKLQGYSLNNIYDSLVNNITGGIVDTVLPAKAEGDLEGQKQTNFAPWMNAGAWFYFDPIRHSYLPVKTSVGSVVVQANPSVNRDQRLQDDNGSIALLSDVYEDDPTVVLPEGTTMVDWDTGRNFKCTLSKDRKTAFFMSHSRDGMKINLLAVNAGGNNTLIWETSVKWPANTAPTMPASVTGSAKSLLVTVRNINGVMYGESTSQQHAPILT